MKRLALLAALALAACSQGAPPRANTQGEAGRKQIDAATRTYSACVDAAAKAAPVAGELPGNLAFAVMKACKPQRDILQQQVAAFWLLGHPAPSPDKADYQRRLSVAVAEASIETLEDDLRSQAVVTIIQRQQASDAAKAG